MPGKVTVVGLGPGEANLITLAAAEVMETADVRLVRTVRHPSLSFLESRGLDWEGLDRFYETGPTFSEVYDNIAEYVVSRAMDCEVCYAVPGDPWVGEATTLLLKEKCAKYSVSFGTTSGVSFLEPFVALAGVNPLVGMTIVDATLCSTQEFTPWNQMAVCQVFSKMVAADLKLKLLEAYPGEHVVQVITGAGTPEPIVQHISLYELDHESTYLSHLTSLYIPPLVGAVPGATAAQGGQLPVLVGVMARLRGDGGCPWDREQSHDSLKPYVVEEAYEVVEAIESGDPDKLAEELGDLLLQVVFHSCIGEESGIFAINDVIDGISAKLIRRHPHVFADVVVADSDAVLVNWERIKRTEKGNESRKSILDGVPIHLPALMKADKLQSKAAKVGFDWDKADDALDKLWEEVGEFKEAWMSQDRDRIEDEMGDLLFAMVNVARLSGLDAEFALGRTIGKFRKRFAHIEARAAASGRRLEEMTLPEMDEYWNEAKSIADESRSCVVRWGSADPDDTKSPVDES